MFTTHGQTRVKQLTQMQHKTAKIITVACSVLAIVIVSNASTFERRLLFIGCKNDGGFHDVSHTYRKYSVQNSHTFS